MTLDVSRALKNPGQAYPFRSTLALPEMEVLSDPVLFEDIRLEGEYFCAGDQRISLKARVEAKAVSRCSRCLERVETPVTARVDALYAKQPDPEDPDLYGFEANAVELEDAVRDALLLELPMRFLCSEDCKGLCPHCGVNLNRETCTCQEGNVTNPFSALKSIVLNNEEV